MDISLGLLILRLVGLVVAAHGAQKLFGWFGGPGFGGTQGFMKSLNFSPAILWALLVIVGKFVGGLLLALGFLTPIGSVLIIGAMLMAMLKVHWKNGFFNSNGGYEFPLTLLLVALAVAILGPGSYSIDAAIGLVIPTWLFLTALVVTIIVDIVGLAVSRQQAAEASAV